MNSEEIKNSGKYLKQNTERGFSNVGQNFFERKIPQLVEDIKWRPMLSQIGEFTNPTALSPKKMSSNIGASESNKGFYIKLAEESPQRSCEESDSATYDSFNNRETDICRDSSDTESCSSNSIAARVEILEYEVATATDSDCLYSNDSSSGTEDYLLATVEVNAILGLTSCASDLADTEESDTDKSYDPELGLADYWICAKCKNKQNNPMYRFCEKCYQIRKTHFPPRPSLRKKRIKRKANIPSISAFNTSSQLNSSAETSSEEDSWSNIDFTTDLSVGNRKRRKRNHTKFNTDIKNVSTNLSSSEHTNLSVVNNIESRLGSNSLNRKRKLSTKSTDDDDIRKTEGSPRKKVACTSSREENWDESDYESHKLLTHIGFSQKDSGISSALSSQEPGSSLSDDHRSNEKPEFLINSCSQETICEELEEHDKISTQDSSIIHNDHNDNFTANKLTGHISELTSSSFNNIIPADPVARSVSSCSGDFIPASNELMVNRSPSICKTLQESADLMKLEPLGGYGNCIICLSEPKNGVFVHSRVLHLCCCYKCAIKVWNKRKRCPICNCTVKNVMKLFVH